MWWVKHIGLSLGIIVGIRENKIKFELKDK